MKKFYVVSGAYRGLHGELLSSHRFEQLALSLTNPRLMEGPSNVEWEAANQILVLVAEIKTWK